MRTFIGTFLSLSLLYFGFVGASAASLALKPADLIAAPNNYLNRTVEVEIIDPLSGPPTPEALARAEYGKVAVEMPDARFVDLSLVPPAFRLEDPNRYKKKFDRVIQGPIRVKGEFLSDEEISKSLHRPVFLIRVASWEPLAPEAPVTVRSLSEIKADPARWDHKRIVYEGVYENRFEVSALDKEIWLSFGRNVELLGKPAGPEGMGVRRDKVRVTGVLYSKPGLHFGHLGGYPYEIVASKVEYLGAAPVP